MIRKVVIVGYSGHSYGCIEVAIEQRFSIIGYHDIVEKISNPYNLKYLGHEETIDPNNKPFIALGDNIIRKKIYKRMKSNSILDTQPEIDQIKNAIDLALSKKFLKLCKKNENYYGKGGASKKSYTIIKKIIKTLSVKKIFFDINYKL